MSKEFSGMTTWTGKAFNAPIAEDVEPEDLSPQAIKLARRIQALPDRRLYLVILIKMGILWVLSVALPGGVKIEQIK